MKTIVTIFPNMEEDKVVAFTVSICSPDGPYEDEYLVQINGHVPISDSVFELKSLARARAKAILKLIADSSQF